MLFLIGVFTSLHCVSMCGAINLSASLSTQTTHSRFRALSKPLLYNLGRLISYSVLGAVIGALGKAVSLSPVLSAVLLLVSASIMFLMALSFLRVIDFHLPTLFARIPLPKKFSAQNAYLSSLLVGLLNGFMPCGPLQALQIYALGTGSAFLGMSALFLFCLGTIPLMLALGVFSTVARGAVKARLTSIGAILILVLSISMLSRALTSLGIRLPEIQLLENASKQPLVAHMDESEAFQTVSFDLDYSEYADIQVKKGIPVRLIITADEDVITGCNNEIICPKLNFSQKLIPGENIIEFTPERTGTFVYSCWMNMIKNTIKVVE